MRELLIASLQAENAATFSRDLAAYLAAVLDCPVRALEDVPWSVREELLLRGEAHLGVVCGLQYVRAVDRGVTPGIELLGAPVMAGPRYQGRPTYFSEIVVRQDHPARSLGELRGASFAFNEPTSHSGYSLPRAVLTARGERQPFFGEVRASGAHQTSLHWIVGGEIEAAAIDTTVLEAELRLDPGLAAQVRSIELLGPSPIPPLVVSRRLPPAERDALRQVLLGMSRTSSGQRVLGAAHMHDLVGVTDRDYDPIRVQARAAACHAPWIASRP